MRIFAIVYIILVIILLWIEKMLYKNSYDEEFKINLKHIEFENKLIHDYTKMVDDIYTELTAKNENITRELLARDKKYNKLLEEYNALKKNKDGKTNENI